MANPKFRQQIGTAATSKPAPKNVKGRRFTQSIGTAATSKQRNSRGGPNRNMAK